MIDRIPGDASEFLGRPPINYGRPSYLVLDDGTIVDVNNLDDVFGVDGNDEDASSGEE